MTSRRKSTHDDMLLAGKVGAANKFAQELERRQKEEAAEKLQSHAGMKNAQRRVSEEFPDSDFVRTPQRDSSPTASSTNVELNNVSSLIGSDSDSENDKTASDHDLLAQEFKQQILNDTNQGTIAEPDDAMASGGGGGGDGSIEAMNIAAKQEAAEKRAFEEVSALAAKELAAELDKQEREEAEMSRVAAEIAREADRREYEEAMAKEVALKEQLELDEAIANSVASSMGEKGEVLEKQSNDIGNAPSNGTTQDKTVISEEGDDGMGGLSTMSIKELKAVALAYNIDTSSCTEKRDLVNLLRSHGVNATTSVPDTSTSTNNNNNNGGGGGASNKPKKTQDESKSQSSEDQQNKSDTGGGGGGGGGSDEKEEEDPASKAAKDMKLQSERASKLIQEELKRLEAREALSGVCGGAAILVGGTVATASMIIVLPAVAGYYKGLPAALSTLLGVTVTVVFVETSVAALSVSHILTGVFNTPRTAAMTLAGYDYDDVELKWVEPNGATPGTSTYNLKAEISMLEEIESSSKETSSKSSNGSGDGGGQQNVNNTNAKGLGGRKVMDLKHYNVLQVKADASGGEIKKAYYKMARKFHPDKNPNNQEAHNRFMEVGVAYQVLSNEKSRREYDHAGLSDSTKAAVDPATMFTMMFGSEQFEPYIGVLAGASLADQVASPPTPEEEAKAHKAAARLAASMKRKRARAMKAAEDGTSFDPNEKDSEDERDEEEERKERMEEASNQLKNGGSGGGGGLLHRIQRKREVMLATSLVARIEPFVSAVTSRDGEESKEAAVSAWEESMKSEAANLADAPFGESLLAGISWAYANSAERFAYHTTQSVFDFSSAFNGIAAGSVGAVRHVERYVNLIGAGATVLQSSAGGDMSNPETGDKVQESAFDLLSHATLMDVEVTLLAVTHRILSDKSVGTKDPRWFEVGDLFSSTTTSELKDSSAIKSVEILAARREALIRLANIYATAKSSNPDPYSWREAFAAAAASSAR